jgi:hypothetical protein
MSERWWMASHEFSTLVSRHLRHLRLRWGLLLLLLLLNGGQSLTDGLNCLSVTPRILQLNFFFSLLAKIRALPFPFLFPLAKP